MKQFANALRVFWHWLGTNHDQVAIVFAVVAGLSVLHEYRSNETDALIKRTLEFQARFGQGEILSSRLKLESYWLSPQSANDLKQAAGTGNEKVTKAVLDNRLDGSVFVLADFFRQIVTCMETGLCHAETTCAVFKRYIVETRNTYFGLFKTWETRWGENIGEDSYQYVMKSCPARSPLTNLLSWLGLIRRS